MLKPLLPFLNWPTQQRPNEIKSRLSQTRMHNCAKRLLKPTPNSLTPWNDSKTSKNRLKNAPDSIAGPMEVEATIQVVNAKTKNKDTPPLQLFEKKKGGSNKKIFQNRWHSGSVCENKKHKNLINHTHCNTFKKSLAIADSGCTSHFLWYASNGENIQPAGANEITATIPNGEQIRSTHNTTLKWPHLPPSTRTCHIFPAHKN